ncbi:MAG: oxygenase MpaB family protein [Phenylobacterium sp.]|uniref:oxygenase MpaB family protein n=1 Tax=Phenylobacterium sp. TaxID=1871053 RepID=UPI00273003D8|nr:oxygenase MpaB family protein [Phenylobacterium sp.]MDP2009645.1 oxygenase MpaB family protein [Phenylobacterium sp.]
MTDMTSYLGWKIDYGQPVGEPAFLDPGSVHWRVYKNPIALAVGGVAAVLLEFADPRIRSGVWDHSTFKTDPIGRSRRTSVAAMVGVYGPQSAARRVIQGVTNMHGRVAGNTPSGEAYKALDVELLDWVSATAGYGFLNAYDRFVSPLSEAEKTRFYEEAGPIARLYGVQSSPKSNADVLGMMQMLVPRFEPHPIVTEFLGIIQSGQAAPGTPKFLHRAVGRASVSLLPSVVRQKLALGAEYDLTATDRIALTAAGKLADHIPVPGSAPCEASKRLGLPANFLYLSRGTQERLLAERPASSSAGVPEAAG